MIPWTSVAPLVLAAAPLSPELDFRGLPPADATAGYKFVVTIRLDGQRPVTFPVQMGAAASPADAATIVASALGEMPWRTKRVGDRLVVYAHGKVRVTGIIIDGDGPKPTVRPVPFVPPPKK